MRSLIRKFDGFLRRRLSVFEFCDPKDCFFRLQVAPAPHELKWPQFLVPAGDPVLIIHLWNEHLPSFSAGGPDLAWGRAFLHGFIRSLQATAGQMKIDPRLAGVEAVGGETALLFSRNRSSGAKVLTQLGFTILPSSNRLGCFGEFWENFYSWLLIWVYNPGSLGFKHLLRMQRAEFWMPSGEFLDLYGRTSHEVRSIRGLPQPASSRRRLV